MTVAKGRTHRPGDLAGYSWLVSAAAHVEGRPTWKWRAKNRYTYPIWAVCIRLPEPHDALSNYCLFVIAGRPARWP